MIINERIAKITVLPKSKDTHKHSLAVIKTQSGITLATSVGMLKDAPISIPDHVQEPTAVMGSYDLIVNADATYHTAGQSYEDQNGNPQRYQSDGYRVDNIDLIDPKLDNMVRQQHQRDKYGITNDIFALNSGATMSFNLGGTPVNTPKTEPKTEPQVGDGGDTGNGEK